jgi:hypothetical protein
MESILCPIGRIGGSAVYDEKRNRMVFFGGKSGGHTLDDTWEMTFSMYRTSWRQLGKFKPEIAPLSRCHHSAVCFPEKNVMIVWGGFHIGSVRDRVLDDLWCFDLDTDKWYEIDQSVLTPPKRTLHSAIYFVRNSKMYIFGGCKTLSRTNSNVYGDMWALDLNTFSKSLMKKNKLELVWEQYSFKQHIPRARYGHLALYHPVKECMYLFGGFGGTKPFTDIWTFSPNGGGWKQIGCRNESRDADSNSENTAFCIRGNIIYIYSGGISPTKTLWTFDTITEKWQAIQLGGGSGSGKKGISPPRWKSTFAYNNAESKLVLYSGSPGLKHDNNNSGSDHLFLSDCIVLNLNKIEKKS